MRFPENNNANQYLIWFARNHSKWCKVAIRPEIALGVHDLTLTTLVKRIMICRRRSRTTGRSVLRSFQLAGNDISLVELNDG